MAVLTRLVVACAAVLGLALPACAGLAASSQQTLTESQAKAGFLYNCAMFVSWPPAAAGRHELIIGVLGDPAVAEVVEDIDGKKVDGRTLRVAAVHPDSDLGSFHILFIAGDNHDAAMSVIARVGRAPVLTIGESERFTSDGGEVRLFTDQGRLRFEINMTRVERAGLKVSAHMLGLARIVR